MVSWDNSVTEHSFNFLECIAPLSTANLEVEEHFHTKLC